MKCWRGEYTPECMARNLMAIIFKGIGLFFMLDDSTFGLLCPYGGFAGTDAPGAWRWITWPNGPAAGSEKRRRNRPVQRMKKGHGASGTAGESRHPAAIIVLKVVSYCKSKY